MNNAEREEHNAKALDHPKPGDFWFERMTCPYFFVVDVKGEEVTVLSCMGGPSSFNRKNEVNARIENDDYTWSFDYGKTMVVDKEWMTKAVTYNNIPGFVADVTRMENSKCNQTLWAEWREFRSNQLRKEVEAKQAEWEEFTGWQALKDLV